MKTLSLRQGYECDHSTRDYGYIAGVDVYYDYGTFDMKFTVPYSMGLFKLLKKYKNIWAEKQFNKIQITLYLYCEDFNEDENEYVNLALEIKEAIINKNVEVMKIIDAYHGEDKKFEKIKAVSELGMELQEVLTLS
ncbi:hypothetical protein HZC30_06030 [Candidatus Woesearchaeota archaeon]|nr:hypothetical protein [Candidatus Woesearchaeota archaeon]